MKKTVATIMIILFVGFTAICYQGRYSAPTNITEITFWQFWTGFEGKAIEKLVEKFNKTHSNLKVKMLTISEPRKKILLSIIGGTPPDVISAVAEWVPELALRNAILPLDYYCKENMITEKLFIPVFWKMLNLYGHTWALPTTPTSSALHWNKNLFKEAGLNPESPPKTLRELEEYSERLTKKTKDGKIVQIGFLPSWPMWSFSFYPSLFSGSWGDSELGKITANNPKNIQAWEWAQSFTRKLGAENIQTFQEEFGNYQGPNNPFYTGMIAIEVNGVWEGNFISYFAPQIKWGIAPVPTIDGKLATVVNTDCILIPKGSKHPKEAFEFIKWLMEPKNLEELCILQKKFSPLLYSDREEFIKKHPNPYIKVFIDLAKSNGAQYFPQITSYQLYARELKREFESVMRLKKEPKEALDEVQKKTEREMERQKKHEKTRTQL